MNVYVYKCPTVTRGCISLLVVLQVCLYSWILTVKTVLLRQIRAASRSGVYLKPPAEKFIRCWEVMNVYVYKCPLSPEDVYLSLLCYSKQRMKRSSPCPPVIWMLSEEKRYIYTNKSRPFAGLKDTLFISVWSKMMAYFLLFSQS